MCRSNGSLCGTPESYIWVHFWRAAHPRQNLVNIKIFPTWYFQTKTRVPCSAAALCLFVTRSVHLDISVSILCSHDDVIKWKHFPRYWPFVWRIHRSPVNSPHNGQWRGALMISLIWAWLSKQSWGWWFETPSRPLWRHCNGIEAQLSVLLWDHFFHRSLSTQWPVDSPHGGAVMWKAFPWLDVNMCTLDVIRYCST